MGQLILSRFKSETIVIRVGEVEILVMVADVRGNKVRLGVDAPPHVSVNREEVQRAIDAKGAK